MSGSQTAFETVWAVVRSGVGPIVVNLPELDEYAAPAAVDYTLPCRPGTDDLMSGGTAI